MLTVFLIIAIIITLIAASALAARMNQKSQESNEIYTELRQNISTTSNCVNEIISIIESDKLVNPQDDMTGIDEIDCLENKLNILHEKLDTVYFTIRYSKDYKKKGKGPNNRGRRP